MPAKFWKQDQDGRVSSEIITGWDTVLHAEEHRPVAENLDRQLDYVLDQAVAKLSDPEVAAINADEKFKMIWSFGRIVKESGILTHQALKNEKQIFLWRVMAAKARLGIRSDYNGGPFVRCEEWGQLRDRSTGRRSQPDVTNKGGGNKDLYETAIWLQQHELQEATFIFGGNLGNAREIGARKGINVPQVRRALKHWLDDLSDQQRHTVHQRKNFQLVAKALTKKWPFKGFGSARRPEHLAPDELLSELRETLKPVASQIFKG